jgi:nicotinate-nucleotide pyrophosphorylase (carboxylating)
LGGEWTMRGSGAYNALAMDLKNVDGIIEAALMEDLPAGDVTSESIIPADSVSSAVLLAKEDGVLAGIGLAWLVFAKIDPNISFEVDVQDGQEFQNGTVLARIQGKSIALLKGERTALNFLQRLSGVATATRLFVKALEGTKTRVLDTRKTTPVMRALEKYAVQQGGGVNHRMSLSDMALIKDNHIEIVGGVGEAVRRAKAKVPAGLKIEVEVTSFEGAKDAVEAGADMIMLDNMPLDRMKAVIGWIGCRVPVEVSGRVTLERAREIAAVGADYVSVGALTHSIRSIDISLEFGRRT